MDITEFYVRKNAWEKLGKPFKIEVSPTYSRKALLNGGNEISVLSCDITDKTIPRTRLTGLKSEAYIQENKIK